MDSLKSAINRAENNSPGEVIISKINNKKMSQVGRSFFDDTREVLHIGLDKKTKHNAVITAEFIT